MKVKFIILGNHKTICSINLEAKFLHIYAQQEYDGYNGRCNREMMVGHFYWAPRYPYKYIAPCVLLIFKSLSP